VPPPPPIELSRDLMVDDRAGDGRGEEIVSRLGELQIPRVKNGRIGLAYGLQLLLLPIQAGPDEPEELSDLAGDLESLSDIAPPGIRIVVAWYADEAVRIELANPGRRQTGTRNAMGLLLGSAWQRELAAHEGDEGAAVDCRGRRLRAMLDAPNNQSVGGARPRTIHYHAGLLDPDFRVAMCIRIRGQWTGEEGVAAAVRSRLAMG
jgi:hypothetical protein